MVVTDFPSPAHETNLSRPRGLVISCIFDHFLTKRSYQCHKGLTSPTSIFSPHKNGLRKSETAIKHYLRRSRAIHLFSTILSAFVTFIGAKLCACRSVRAGDAVETGSTKSTTFICIKLWHNFRFSQTASTRICWSVEPDRACDCWMEAALGEGTRKRA